MWFVGLMTNRSICNSDSLGRLNKKTPDLSITRWWLPRTAIFSSSGIVTSKYFQSILVLKLASWRNDSHTLSEKKDKLARNQVLSCVLLFFQVLICRSIYRLAL